MILELVRDPIFVVDHLTMTDIQVWIFCHRISLESTVALPYWQPPTVL
jgi:hypothetical protein